MKRREPVGRPRRDECRVLLEKHAQSIRIADGRCLVHVEAGLSGANCPRHLLSAVVEREKERREPVLVSLNG